MPNIRLVPYSNGIADLEMRNLNKKESWSWITSIICSQKTVWCRPNIQLKSLIYHWHLNKTHFVPEDIEPIIESINFSTTVAQELMKRSYFRYKSYTELYSYFVVLWFKCTKEYIDDRVLSISHDLL